MTLLNPVHRPVQPSLFHKTGLIYFWFLNDACDPSTIDRHLRAYADADVAAVCLHARHGLTLPYGSHAWFQLIRDITVRCDKLGMQVWLYDEDPFPSGNAGGRILMEHPEYRGHGIEMDIASPENCEDNLFIFQPGKLLWCGIIDEHDQAVDDLTAEVGVIRRRWEVLDPWDSRYYYPATPLYNSPRSRACDPELSVRLPRGGIESLRPGHRLAAFTARPCAKTALWGGLVDTLNPRATQAFLNETHKQYADTVGEFFGGTITAMFTDEPKFHHQHPHCPGLLEDFAAAHGYDLRPRLAHLFSNNPGDESKHTRLQYRQFCSQRFIDAWMKPNAQWCARHGLKFVGHISPEDDPVEQSSSLGNLFPIQKHFDLPGLDLIIPAVGDARHGMINIGPILALSVQQQQRKAGVMSEMLGVSGIDMTGQTARRIIHWQTLMGVTSPVIHGGFNSVQGHRLIDAPPDSGPDSRVWQDMQDINASVAPLQQAIRGSVNIAPVAILWPIRSFNMLKPAWQDQPGGLRGQLIDLITRCLDRQIGIHLLDEDDLQQAAIDQDTLRAGHASYQHILIPPASVLHARSIAMLRQAHEQGIDVTFISQLPPDQQQDHRLEPAFAPWASVAAPDQAVASLPRLIDLPGDSADIRCTAWQQGQTRHLLVMNLRPFPCTIDHDSQTFTLALDEIRIITSRD